MQGRLYLSLVLIKLERGQHRYRISLLLEKFEKYEIGIFCLLVQQRFEASNMPYNVLNQSPSPDCIHCPMVLSSVIPARFLKKVVLFHNSVPNVKLGME